MIDLEQVAKYVSHHHYQDEACEVIIDATIPPTLEGIDALAAHLRKVAREVQDVANTIGGNA